MDIVTLAQQSSLEELQTKLQAILPQVSVSWQNLGGIPSVFIHASLDEQNSWINGIFHNSRYSIFAIHDDMKLEQISRQHLTAKLRKSKVTGIDSIVAKIEKWSQS